MGRLGVDVVYECTGLFARKEKAQVISGSRAEKLFLRLVVVMSMLPLFMV